MFKNFISIKVYKYKLGTYYFKGHLEFDYLSAKYNFSLINQKLVGFRTIRLKF